MKDRKGRELKVGDRGDLVRVSGIRKSGGAAWAVVLAVENNRYKVQFFDNRLNQPLRSAPALTPFGQIVSEDWGRWVSASRVQRINASGKALIGMNRAKREGGVA